MKLSPTDIYQGRRIFLIGSTGFLGKVTLSMLLHRFPNIARVYVTVRARSAAESETRFWEHVITAPPFDPLRERYGSAFEGFIRDKVEVVGGDIGDKDLGYSEDEAQKIADDVSVKGREIITDAKKEWDSSGTARTTGTGTRSGGATGGTGSAKS